MGATLGVPLTVGNGGITPTFRDGVRLEGVGLALCTSLHLPHHVHHVEDVDDVDNEEDVHDVGVVDVDYTSYLHLPNLSPLSGFSKM